MSAELNLSRRPFLNPRPVLRLTILLWVVGLILAAFNGHNYWSHFSGSSDTREQQQTLAASIESEQQQLDALRTKLAGYDLEWQNDQSAFLNAKIAERSFSWSQLFDRLGEVLPADARVANLSPEFSSSRRRGSRQGPGENEVELGIRGIAKDSGVLLEFIDSLFGHPSFRDPDLTSESLNDTGVLDFSLSVIYEARPPVPEAPTEELVAEGPAEDEPSDLTTAESDPAAADDDDNDNEPATRPAAGSAEPAESTAADTSPEATKP